MNKYEVNENKFSLQIKLFKKTESRNISHNLPKCKGFVAGRSDFTTGFLVDNVDNNFEEALLVSTPSRLLKSIFSISSGALQPFKL